MSRIKDEKTQNTYKVVLLGDNAVGKTWICHQLVGQYFDHSTLLTIGVDFFVHNIKLQDETTVKLKIWDTAGQEAFLSIVKPYYQQADGIIMIYDITKKDSFETAIDRINMLNRNELGKCVFLLVGNKSDCEEHRQVSREEGLKYAEENGFMFEETSAYSSESVQQIFENLATQMNEIKLNTDPDLDMRNENRTSCCNIWLLFQSFFGHNDDSG